MCMPDLLMPVLSSVHSRWHRWVVLSLDIPRSNRRAAIRTAPITGLLSSSHTGCCGQRLTMSEIRLGHPHFVIRGSHQKSLVRVKADSSTSPSPQVSDIIKIQWVEPADVKTTQRRRTACFECLYGFDGSGEAYAAQYATEHQAPVAPGLAAGKMDTVQEGDGPLNMASIT
ncbi:hypothetical protein JDV02_004087 [Purpureocillium takamizusanense]|uniref:Uncharacterized protein n=1 Tax=Purpureocillium takamizusanense TaxID=2060973 RepID=A0A9Q8QFJ3_9HYPO|nr:uncharacterized protein JDV02_004087 [Purpureocillium takamizusanense]UNI17767.1 hypothetical protein JDV02_004087 [Purpureocillium takamizusanense]